MEDVGAEWSGVRLSEVRVSVRARLAVVGAKILPSLVISEL